MLTNTGFLFLYYFHILSQSVNRFQKLDVFFDAPDGEDIKDEAYEWHGHADEIRHVKLVLVAFDSSDDLCQIIFIVKKHQSDENDSQKHVDTAQTNLELTFFIKEDGD